MPKKIFPIEVNPFGRKKAGKKLLGLILILGALWLLGMKVGSTEATMHWGNPCSRRVNPCYARANPCYAGGGNYSLSWVSQLVGFFVLLLGFYIFFGSAVSTKIKNIVRPRQRK